jgi:hypothetical protein
MDLYYVDEGHLGLYILTPEMQLLQKLLGKFEI